MIISIDNEMAFNKIQHPLKMKTLDLHLGVKAVLQAMYTSASKRELVS